MKINSMFARRFNELETQASKVEDTKHIEQRRQISGTKPREYVDENLLLNWKTKTRHLLNELCGPASEHYGRFAETENLNWSTNYYAFTALKAIFQAAHEDYLNGYLNKMQSIIQAEVFDSELEQARNLLDNGYTTAAAVIAGVVLETTLRQICTDNQIQAGKLDKMNADLAKLGVYNLLTQKRITALADIRNNAAHGHSERYNQADVIDMIAYIRSFIEERL